MSAPTDPASPLPTGTASLRPFVDAGVLHDADVQVAGAVTRLVPGCDDPTVLATALCVRALQLGHVCVVLDHVAATVAVDFAQDGAAELPPGHGGPRPTPGRRQVPTAIEDLPWPDAQAWAGALRASPAVTTRDPATGAPAGPTEPGVLRPLVFDGTRVYLERYWRFERQVGDILTESRDATGDGVVATLAVDVVEAALDRFFGSSTGDGPDRQRHGAQVALTHRVSVLAGGPGTGKTHTVARLLATVQQVADASGRSVEVALAAPTGKAAARMTEAVDQAVDDLELDATEAERLRINEAVTLHRLLGYRDGLSFRHNRADPLPHDVVVIDETSMVALPLMARLLDALRPETHLVLVGDPFQLASVEAGAVLGDIVGPAARLDEPPPGPLADSIVVLRRAHRFAADSAIAALADAVRTGDADRAIEILSSTGSPEVGWVRPDDPVGLRGLRRTVATAAADSAQAALAGDATGALERAVHLKVLCATRYGPLGSHAWQHHIEARLPGLVGGLTTQRRHYVGRPVIVTRNDYITRVFNGDVGVIVAEGDRPVVALPGPEGVRTLAPSQLDAVETWWAMTIHKSQGSEFDHAVVSLPRADSRILSRELLYTGVTRGRSRVTVVADEAALRRAIANPVSRASGLQSRLWP